MHINRLNNIFSNNKANSKSMLQIKQEFFKYLEEKDNTGKIDAAELMASDASIFMYAGEFKKFLAAEGSDLGLGDDFSGNITDIINMEFDDKNGELIAGKDATEDQQTLIGMINDLFKNEDVIKAADVSGEGKISQKEMTDFLNAMNAFDNNSEELSLEDFFGAVEGIENGTFNPANGIIPPNLAAPADPVNPVSPADTGAPSAPGSPTAASGPSGTSSNPIYGSNGVPATPLETKTSQTETSDAKANEIAEIDRQIAAKNDEINSLTSEKAEAYSANNEYKTLTSDLKTVNDAVSTATSNITTFEKDLHGIQTEMATKQSELDNLQDPQVFTEYKDEINAKRNELKSAIETLKTKEQETQQKLDTEKTKLSENEGKQQTLEKQISDFEKANPNDKVNEINSKIETLKSDISSLKQQKEQKQAEIKQTREQEKSDGEVYGKMTAYRQSEFVKYMMDYATADSTANAYNSQGHQGAWCAQFTSEVTEHLLAEVARRTGTNLGGGQDLNGSQMAMHAVAWGNMVQNALNNAGINKNANVDIAHMSLEERKDAVRKGLIYPGMTFEYEANGGYHTGFIESINPDLTWNTIEGNSTGGKVGRNRRDATNNRLTSVTDSVLNAWYLARGIYKRNGIDINKAIYNA